MLAQKYLAGQSSEEVLFPYFQGNPGCDHTKQIGTCVLSADDYGNLLFQVNGQTIYQADSENNSYSTNLKNAEAKFKDALSNCACSTI